jgi:2,4-dienoyl-CoA reductase (NADPH2)
MNPFERRGNTIEDSIEIVRLLAARGGVDAFHISTGSTLAHPRNPAGALPWELAVRTYAVMIGSGRDTWRNYLIFRYLPWLARLLWQRTQTDFRAGGQINGELRRDRIKGLNADAAGQIRAALHRDGYDYIPGLCTGGFQTGDGISRVLNAGLCDAVTIARPLLAVPNLPRLLEGKQPRKPCTYCNKCLVHVLENPLGCCKVDRFDGDWDRMIAATMSIFEDEVGVRESAGTRS